MKKRKLVQGLCGVGLLALGAYQAPDVGATSCTAGQQPWTTATGCPGSGDKVWSQGTGSGSTKTLVVYAPGCTDGTIFADAYGYTSLGTRLSNCRAVAGSDGGVCRTNGADNTGCSTAVTHDAYAAW